MGRVNDDGETPSFVPISSPSVPMPRHYPGGMDVTGVSQLLDHPTPGGTEYLGRTGQDTVLRLVEKGYRNRLPTTG